MPTATKTKPAAKKKVTLESVLRDLMRSGMSPVAATDAACSRSDIGILVWNTVRALAIDVKRQEVRRREHTIPVVGGKFPNVRETVSDMRAKLAQDTFTLPNGETVLWLTATVEQHQVRAQWQRQQAEPHIRDAEIHEASIAAIRKFKGSCLADVPVSARPLKVAA